MAQLRHNHFLDTVDAVFNHARAQHILHLHADPAGFDGRFIQIEGQRLKHFGTTSYLGLGLDERIKKAAISAIEAYGTQFPLSKTYIAHPLYQELETLLEAMYGRPVIVTKNATLAHMAALPVLVGDADTVILDHQVHWSVQDAANRLKLRGVKVLLIRHNRMDLLEARLQELGSTSHKIWYMADGVYSMHGDYAPLEALKRLAHKYKQLQLYFDDVHGMSWAGKHGTGVIYDHLQELLPRSVVIGTLSKTFGANGALIICGDLDAHHKIKTFGGPLTFSAQLDPASVGAAIAAARLHLTSELNDWQQDLQKRVVCFNALLKKYKLPLVAVTDAPVFFLATGVPETGYQLTRRLLDRGYFVNMGLFPAVPSKNTGLRITVSLKNTLEDIQGLARCLQEEYPRVLQATGNDFDQLSAAFKQHFEVMPMPDTSLANLSLIVEETIEAVDQSLWDTHFKGFGILDWEGWRFVEQVFAQAALPEHHWKFKYLQIKDAQGELLLLAAFTQSLWKEDVLAPLQISEAIEKKRIKDPYYLCSEVLSLGSLFSDGLPLYLQHEHPQATQALNMMLKTLEDYSVAQNLSQLVFRDLDLGHALDAWFNQKGFIPVAMPETALVTSLDWKNQEAYLNDLSTRSRKHFKRDILPFRNLVHCKVQAQLSDVQLQLAYGMYQQVKARNLALNTFTYPYRLFEAMNTADQWEFLVLYAREGEQLLGVLFCYRNGTTYVPSLIGMEYTHAATYKTYRQLLYESLLRARQLHCTQVDWGISANFEKRKLGAQLLPKQAYMRRDGNFMMDYIEAQHQLKIE